MADDLGGTAPGIDEPAPRARAQEPQRDPLAPGGVPPELQGRMLEDAEATIKKQQEYMTAEEKAAKERPALPKLGKVPPAPQNDMRGDAMAWLGFATALGGIAGAMTKRSSMNALAAFSGTLEGLQQGNQQKFNDNFKTWEANAKATQENNKAEMDGYRNILERQDLDHRQRADQLEMWATVNRNKFMIDLARASKDDPALFTAALDSMSAKAEKGNDAVSRLVEARERAREARENRMEEEKQRQLDRLALAQATGRSSVEDEGALMQRVDQAISGNWRGAVQGLRAGSPNETAFRNLFASELKARGISPEQQNKAMQDYAGAMTEAQSLGRYGARAGTATAEVAQAIAPVLQASDALPRGKFVPLNELMNNYRKYSSDPQYADLMTKLIALKNAYIRAMNPTSNATEGPRLELRIAEMLTASTSPQALETQLRGIMLETQNMERGVDVARGRAPPPPDPFVGRPNPLERRPQPRGGAGRMQTSPGAIPQGAIEMLRKDPSLRPQFDAKYGAGQADRILGAP